MAARVIGLLGGSGAGKSTVAKWFASRGCTVVDADRVSRDLTHKDAPGYDAVVREFGPEILDETGAIDRRRLAHLVFTDPEQLERLEAVLHPLMAQEIERQISASPSDTVILDCAVLLRPIFRRLVGEVWFVFAPEEARVARIMQRDGLTEEQARERIGAQDTDTMRREADVEISNDRDTASLSQQLDRALREAI